MRDIYEELEELCHTTCEKLSEVNQKIRAANGKLTAGDLEYMDRLTHMLKSIKTTMAMIENEGNSFGGSYDTSYYSRRGGRSYDGMSRRGGYSGRMYRDTGTINQLRQMMEQTDDDRMKEEFQRMIEKMEHM